MGGGTYTLVVEHPAGGLVTVGALGERHLPAGWYAYTGSALGSGGFTRVERHRELAAGERDTRHWHIDHLLGAPGTRIDAVETTPAAVECAVARRIGDATDSVPALDGFGCSDCACESHLAHHEQRADLLAAVQESHAAVADGG